MWHDAPRRESRVRASQTSVDREVVRFSTPTGSRLVAQGRPRSGRPWVNVSNHRINSNGAGPPRSATLQICIDSTNNQTPLPLCVPSGTTDNSPPIHRWDFVDLANSAPLGATDIKARRGGRRPAAACPLHDLVPHDLVNLFSSFEISLVESQKRNHKIMRYKIMKRAGSWASRFGKSGSFCRP